MRYQINWIQLSPMDRRVEDQIGRLKCSLCSAIIRADDRYSHEMFHETYTNNTEVTSMSNVKWCDPGNHAFKAGQPGSQTFSGTQINEAGETVSMNMDACPDHSFQSPVPDSAKTPPEIPTYREDPR